LLGTSLNNLHQAIMLVDVESKNLVRGVNMGVDDRVQHVARLTTLRSRFNAVGLTERGDLALQSHRGQVVSFNIRTRIPVFAVEQHGTKLQHERRFTPLKSNYGFQLSVARWNNGSQCVLDSRGLLHLRAANPTTPETTLVLTEGEFSGWASDNRVWGKKYFVGSGPNALTLGRTMREAFEATVKQFVEGIVE
jgi:hypothetical protein